MNDLRLLLGASSDDFLCVADHREAAHLQALFNVLVNQLRPSGKTHALIATGEHPSLKQAIDWMGRLEIVVRELPANAQGQITRETLEAFLKPRTGLVCLSWAQEWTGVIHPLADLAAFCQERGVHLHVDATLVFGKLYMPFQEFGIDSLVIGEILLGSKDKLLFPLYPSLSQPLEKAFKKLMHASEELEAASLEQLRLRDRFEKQLTARLKNAQIVFQQADRLDDRLCFALEGLHGERIAAFLRSHQQVATAAEGALASYLLSCGVAPLIAYGAVSLYLGALSTDSAVDQLIDRLVDFVRTTTPPSAEDAAQKGMRLVQSKTGAKEDGCALHCYLIVDESDGIIADCRWDWFGPVEMQTATEAASQLLLRKSYMQAKHLTADRLEQKMGYSSLFTNQILELLDEAALQCMDIPLDEVLIAPQAMEKSSSDAQEYPNWSQLEKAAQIALIEEIIAADIRPYVEMDAGGVEVIDIEHPHVRLAYKGACTTCYSATGATLDAIQNILRTKLHQSLVVIPEF